MSLIIRGNANKKIGLTSQEVLYLVEGPTELHLVDHILQLNGYTDYNRIGILDLGSGEKIMATLEALKLDPNFTKVKSIGIVIDAETNFSVTFGRVNEALSNVGFPTSTDNIASFISNNGSKKSSFFISPGNTNNGELEDLIISEVRTKPENDILIEIERLCMEKGLMPLDSKALVSIYCSLKGVHAGAGVAFKHGVLDCTNEVYDDMTNTLLAIL